MSGTCLVLVAFLVLVPLKCLAEVNRISSHLFWQTSCPQTRTGNGPAIVQLHLGSHQATAANQHLHHCGSASPLWHWSCTVFLSTHAFKDGLALPEHVINLLLNVSEQRKNSSSLQLQIHFNSKHHQRCSWDFVTGLRLQLHQQTTHLFFISC